MRTLSLKLLLIIILALFSVYRISGQSDRSRLTFGVGIRPMKTISAGFKIYLSDRFGLRDTIQASVFGRAGSTSLGGYVGLEQNPENDIFTQLQIDFDFGGSGNHYIAAILGLGHTLGNNYFSLNPCLNLWVGHMSTKLATINTENLYIRSGKNLLDVSKTVTLEKTSMLWGLSPNLILGIKLGTNTQVRITFGYLGTLQTNHKLVFSGKDKDDDSLSAKVKIDKPGSVEVGPANSIAQIKSMLSLQGFYFTLGLLL